MDMKKNLVALAFVFISSTASAGVLDPDCNAEKAAKSAAAKATIGVGGRCTPAEAAKDMASDKVEDVVPDKMGDGKVKDKLGHKDEPSVKKVVKKVTE